MKDIKVYGSIKIVRDKTITEIDLSNGGHGTYLCGYEVRKYIRNLARQLRRASA